MAQQYSWSDLQRLWIPVITLKHSKHKSAWEISSKRQFILSTTEASNSSHLRCFSSLLITASTWSFWTAMLNLNEVLIFTNSNAEPKPQQRRVAPHLNFHSLNYILKHWSTTFNWYNSLINQIEQVCRDSIYWLLHHSPLRNGCTVLTIY